MNNKGKLEQEYNGQIKLYQEFSLLVKNILEQFLNSNNFRFQLISNRAKDVKKLSEKIDRKKEEGKDYKKLSDIEDLAGVRIVFYLETDKNKFLQKFREIFRTSIVDFESKYNPRGYQGVHTIFRLDPTRVRLPEYARYKGLKCEIQTTSILYHAWSEVEHDIIYKPKGNPNLLKTLGLNDLEKTFEKLMTEHIQAATLQLDFINKKYEEIARAGEILGSDFVSDILSSTTNDEIFEKLEVVEKFYYKKPEEILAIIDAIFKRKPIEPKIIHHFRDQDLYGKDHKEILMKGIDLLSSIRYYKIDDVLALLSKLSLSDDKDIKQKVLDVVKNLSKYDFNILTKTKIGYGAQSKVFDFISAWPANEQIEHFDFIEVASMQLLDPSVNGTTSGLNENNDYTITMHSGAVQPTDFLKQLRKKTIDLLYVLYQSTNSTSLHIRIIRLFQEATSTPMSVAYGDDLEQMIHNDAEYLSDLYRKIVFPENKLSNELSVVKEIEEKLYWLNRSEKFQNENSKKLRTDILTNNTYRIFRLFVGNPVTYREQEGWDIGEKKRNEEIEKIEKSITQKNLTNWMSELNNIASQIEFIEEWQFQPLKKLLRKLASRKPHIAEIILRDAIDNSKPLYRFASIFLDGFREVDEFNIWDKFLKLITRSKNRELTEALVFSLNISPEKDIKKSIRNKDIDTLKNILRSENLFSYLRGEKNDRILRYALINALMRNFQRDTRKIEDLLIEEISNHSEYTTMYFNQIPVAIHRGWLGINDLSQKSISFLKRKIIELPQLDWHIQEILQTIGSRDFEGMMNIFHERIKMDIKNDELKKVLKKERYEPIPYHFNPELIQVVSNHPDYPKYLEKWLSGLTEDWSLYNWHIAHFIQRIGSRFNDIIKILVDKGDDGSLMKATRLMNSIDGVDFDLSIEIVRQTKDKKVISQVKSNMYSTGLVSGEYGLANAYEAKSKALEKYKSEKDKHVKKFAEEMIKSFMGSALTERQRADEEKQVRRIEFEG